LSISVSEQLQATKRQTCSIIELYFVEVGFISYCRISAVVLNGKKQLTQDVVFSIVQWLSPLIEKCSKIGPLKLFRAQTPFDKTIDNRDKRQCGL